jgi:hypothetical protein
MDPAPHPGRLRWLLLFVWVALLPLLLVSGALAIRILDEMHGQQPVVTHALAARTQMLSGLLLSIQSYNQSVQQFVAQEKADRDQAARQHLDQLTVEIDSDLKHYPTDRDAAETALLDGMQDVFRQQRTLYISVLAAGPDERRRRAQSPISGRTIALQEQILDWSGKLRTWNGERLQQAAPALVAEFGRLQGGLSRVLTIGFGSGL